MPFEHRSWFGLRAKLLVVVGAPLAIAVCLLAVFTVSRSIADGRSEEALDWNEHAIAILDLQTKANAYFDGVTETRGPAELAQRRQDLAAADARALQLAARFDARERREQAQISRDLRTLVDQTPVLGSYLQEEQYNLSIAPRLDARARDELAGSRHHAAAGRNASKQVLVIGGLLSLVLLCAGAFVALRYTREILRGVDHLAQGVARVRSGVLDAPIEICSYDELGRLAVVFNEMSTSLHEHRSNLEGLVQKRLEQTQTLEAQLRQVQKMEAVGQLAGGIAHDFNNILAVIIANAELTLAEMQPDDPARPDIDEILVAAKRAADLTRQLLAFSRNQKSEPKTLDLNELVTTSERMLRRVIGESISIALELAPDLHYTWADAGQLDQVITNLVINARDAMPSGGKLTIRTENVGPGVALTVSDTGIGMDETTRARAFEPFFTTKEVGKGTGLGLAMVFGIVTQHQGTVEIESKVGVGTTFRILLPRTSRDAASQAEFAKARPLARGSESVMVVEDDTQLRNVLVRQLRTLGYEVHSAPDASSALDTLARSKNAIDLVLTDLVMPDMDGRVLAQEIVRRRYKTSVLFMSGYSQHPKLEMPGRSPEGALLSKPILQETLAVAVRAALTKRRTGRISSPRLAMDELAMVNGLFSE